MAQMELIQLNAQTWVIQGGANIGVLAHDGHCLLIDSGIDKDVGREILKQVKKPELKPTGLLITHAHADHIGGAQYLVRQAGIKVYATGVEAAVMSSPILEPLYLFSGAYPPRELQQKFLLARPCPVDVVLTGDETAVDGIPLRVVPLPGHSVEQIGVAFGETLFVGDAFLTPELLDKHGIPFYTNVQKGLETLNELKKLHPAFKYVVAGHGEIYRSIERVNWAIECTIARLKSILDNVRTALADGATKNTAEVLGSVATAQGVTIGTLSQFVLCHTTVQSALAMLYAQGEVFPIFKENNLLWGKGEKEKAVTP